MTCTTKLPRDVFPAASDAQHETVVSPIEKLLPITWSQLTGTGPSTLSNAEIDHLRSEEHTSELQSLRHLVCRLLLEKKKKKKQITYKINDKKKIRNISTLHRGR